jgi:hypothetical protein
MNENRKKSKQLKKKPVLLKKCSKCHEVKEITEFHTDRSRGDGFSTKCKRCEYECHKSRRERLQSRMPEQLPNIATKQCSKCGETKSVTEFYPDLRIKDGYSSWCKSCFRRQGQIYHKRLAARRKSKIQHIENKRCPKCGEVKSITEFYKSVGKLDGHATICRECNKKNRTNYTRKVADREFDEIQPKGKKWCWMCRRRLPVEEFSFSRSNYDGLSSHCRECGKAYKLQHYEQYYGEYYERTRQYRREKPERYRCYWIVQEAIKNGDLVRPGMCSKCGKRDDIVAHHDDYNRPFDIVWLCVSCDRQLHADLRRKQKG